MERGPGWTEAREDIARPEVTWQVVPSEVRLGKGSHTWSRQRGGCVQRPWGGAQPAGFAGPLGGWSGRRGAVWFLCKDPGSHG